MPWWTYALIWIFAILVAIGAGKLILAALSAEDKTDRTHDQ